MNEFTILFFLNGRLVDETKSRIQPSHGNLYPYIQNGRETGMYMRVNSIVVCENEYHLQCELASPRNLLLG